MTDTEAPRETIDALREIFVDEAGNVIGRRDGASDPITVDRTLPGQPVIPYVRVDIHDEAVRKMERLLEAAKQAYAYFGPPRHGPPECAEDANSRALRDAIAECEEGEG